MIIFYINMLICGIALFFATGTYTDWTTFNRILVSIFTPSFFMILLNIPIIRNIVLLIFSIMDSVIAGFLALSLLDEIVYADAPTKLLDNQTVMIITFVIFTIIFYFVNLAATKKDGGYDGTFLSLDKQSRQIRKDKRRVRREIKETEKELKELNKALEAEAKAFSLNPDIPQTSTWDKL